MKTLIIFAALVTSATAFSAELRCWKTNFRQASTPFLIADIVNNKTIANVRFLYKNSPFENFEGEIVGKINSNNRSSYKGNMIYSVSENFFITLPEDLSNKNLVAVEPYGIGLYKDENGVIVSMDDADRVCDSYCTQATVRLSCRSTL
ncbi:MAG: hypothetical protein KA715_14290 [Xanthomonadaceae bacterium]|nr:hypothetical protein [Xanthomonadaceae bacterium]